MSWSHFEAEHRNILVLKGLRFQFRKLLCIYLKRPMAVHVPRRWDVKWVVGKALIAFLLLVSVSATSSHQNTDNKTTSPSNGTIGVDYHAKAFYKHHWPVRVFTSQIYDHNRFYKKIMFSYTFVSISNNHNSNKNFQGHACDVYDF